LSKPSKVSGEKVSVEIEVFSDVINHFLLGSQITGQNLPETVGQGLCLEGEHVISGLFGAG
jgi:hypothetical protein